MCYGQKNSLQSLGNLSKLLVAFQKQIRTSVLFGFVERHSLSTVFAINKNQKSKNEICFLFRKYIGIAVQIFELHHLNQYQTTPQCYPMKT